MSDRCMAKMSNVTSHRQSRPSNCFDWGRVTLVVGSYGLHSRNDVQQCDHSMVWHRSLNAWQCVSVTGFNSQWSVSFLFTAELLFQSINFCSTETFLIFYCDSFVSPSGTDQFIRFFFYSCDLQVFFHPR